MAKKDGNYVISSANSSNYIGPMGKIVKSIKQARKFDYPSNATSGLKAARKRHPVLQFELIDIRSLETSGDVQVVPTPDARDLQQDLKALFGNVSVTPMEHETTLTLRVRVPAEMKHITRAAAMLHAAGQSAGQVLELHAEHVPSTINFLEQ